VLEVADLYGHVDPCMLVLVAVRLHRGDVGVDVGDARADGRKHALAVLHRHRQLDGVACDGVALVPLDLDAPLRVVQQVDDVGTRG
jgi:hypothetical protein